MLCFLKVFLTLGPSLTQLHHGDWKATGQNCPSDRRLILLLILWLNLKVILPTM